jgi:hypothetical protein
MQSDIQRMSRRDPLIFGDQLESAVRDGCSGCLRARREEQHGGAEQWPEKI